MAKDSRLHRVFCDNVKRRRKELGLTQGEVAERLGVSQPAYAAIETGRNDPSLDVVERVAVALAVHPATLMMPQPKEIPAGAA